MSSSESISGKVFTTSASAELLRPGEGLVAELITNLVVIDPLPRCPAADPPVTLYTPYQAGYRGKGLVCTEC